MGRVFVGGDDDEDEVGCGGLAVDQWWWRDGWGRPWVTQPVPDQPDLVEVMRPMLAGASKPFPPAYLYKPEPEVRRLAREGDEYARAIVAEKRKWMALERQWWRDQGQKRATGRDVLY